MKFTCTNCEAEFIFDSHDGPTHGSPEMHDFALLNKGERVGTAYADGPVLCAECDASA